MSRKHNSSYTNYFKIVEIYKPGDIGYFNQFYLSKVFAEKKLSDSYVRITSKFSNKNIIISSIKPIKNTDGAKYTFYFVDANAYLDGVMMLYRAPEDIAKKFRKEVFILNK